MRIMKKMLAGLLAAAVAVSCVVPAYASETSPDDSTTKTPVAQETTVEQKGMTASVATDAKGNAAMTEVKSSKKTVAVSAKVTVDGVKYNVTTIGANAFKDCKKATKIELPKTVETIGAKAFTGAKKLKTLTLKSTKAPTINKKAFKSLDTKKMVIKYNKKMSAKQVKKLKKQLKKAGFKGKLKKA